MILLPTDLSERERRLYSLFSSSPPRVVPPSLLRAAADAPAKTYFILGFVFLIVFSGILPIIHGLIYTFARSSEHLIAMRWPLLAGWIVITVVAILCLWRGKYLRAASHGILRQGNLRKGRIIKVYRTAGGGPRPMHESVIIEMQSEGGGIVQVRDAIDAQWLEYYRDLRDTKSEVDVLYSLEWPKRAILLKKLALSGVTDE